MASPGSQGTEPPDRIRFSWSRSDRPVPRRILQPLQSFLGAETASGVVLVAAAVAALIWANSPLRDSYEQLWGTELTLRISRWAIVEDLRHWVNDGLMALFFLVAGLEIKRELLTGELRDRRAAALPVVAAIGGVVVPVAIYLAINAGGDGSRGWGVVAPTDIVFALGVLALAAPSAPPGLRSFVLALAIVDDLVSIIFVAVFYSGQVEWGGLAVALGLSLTIYGLVRIHVRASAVYLLLGAAIWLSLERAGVTPAVAGVIVAFLTPAVPFQRPAAVSQEAHRVADDTVDDPFPPDADAHHWEHLAQLAREAVSPLARIESRLHLWTSFLVVPLFALANAGVELSADVVAEAGTDPISIGIVVARVLGKPIGITLATALAIRFGLARLPDGVDRRLVLGVGAAAAIPFTVSFFVADLAFAERAAGDVARVGILAAAVLAGLIGFVVLSGSARPGRGSSREERS